MEDALQSWQRLVRCSPISPALYWPDGRVVPREELEDKSGDLVQIWSQAGLKPHRLLALHLPNGVDWMVAFLACLKLKAVMVPFDPGISREETLNYLTDLRAQALWDGTGLEVVEHVKPRVMRDRSIDTCKLTSGSTGKPKPLFFSNDEMMADGVNITATMGIRSRDTNLGVIPWGHSYGLGSIVYPLLIQGTKVTWSETPFPADIVNTCEKTRSTVFPAVPTLLKALNRSVCEKQKLSTLRLVISAGARLEPEVVRTFRDIYGIAPRNFYGSTETGGIAFDATGEASLTGGSVGTPIRGVKIEKGRGRRFYVAGPAVYRFGNPYARRNSASRHLAADYGYLDSNGELVLHKRAKGLVKIGGRRINPAEVESRIERLSTVGQAIVFGLEVNDETILAAALETTAGRGVVVRALRQNLPKRLRPKKIICFQSFPTNHRGKVDLAAIRRSFD